MLKSWILTSPEFPFRSDCFNIAVLTKVSPEKKFSTYGGRGFSSSTEDVHFVLRFVRAGFVAILSAYITLELTFDADVSSRI